MNKTLKALMALGLTEKEAQIYIALYKIGEGTSYEIAKESGIKRPTVYATMESLRVKGLALVVPHAKKTMYIAKDPNEFISEFQSSVQRSTNDLISFLPKLSRPSSDTIVFRGEGALAQGLSYGMQSVKNKAGIAFYAGIGKNAKVTDEYNGHFERLYNLGIKMRCVTPSDSHDAKFREEDKKYGFVTKKVSAKIFSPSVSTEVFDDLVKTVFHKKKEVIVIRDKGLADFYRQMFEVFWKG